MTEELKKEFEAKFVIESSFDPAQKPSRKIFNVYPENILQWIDEKFVAKSEINLEYALVEKIKDRIEKGTHKE